MPSQELPMLKGRIIKRFHTSSSNTKHYYCSPTTATIQISPRNKRNLTMLSLTTVLMMFLSRRLTTLHVATQKL